jgi:8-oxo-dGTP diphosphatase
VRHRAALATLCFVCHRDRVLLLRRDSGSDRFAGLWNGIGGHVEAGEDIAAAAWRELREEAGVEPQTLRLRGLLHESGLLGQAYVIFLFVGNVADEGLRPAPGIELGWQPLSRLGELALVPDLPVLLPRLLGSEEVVFATQTFDGGDRPLALVVFDPPCEPSA